MRFTKKIVAILCSAAMLLGSVSTSVFAAQGQIIFNNQYGTQNLGFAPEQTVAQADPGAEISSINIEAGYAGSVTKKVGDTGMLASCPLHSLNCGKCNNPLIVSNPVVYAEADVSFSNPGIIKSDGFTNVATSIDTDFENAHSIQFNYEAVKPGSTLVTVTYYVNYYMELGTAQVNYLTCRKCQTRNTGSDFEYHKVTQTFDVTVEGDQQTYTVIYTDGVEGETVFSDQAYEDLKSGDTTPKFEGTPERDGYIFMGWAPTVADTVTEDVTYTATWEKNKPVTPVDPENPDDPKPGEKTTDPTVKKTIDGNVQSVKPEDTLGYTITTNVPDYLGQYLPIKDKNGNVVKDAEKENGEFKLTVHDDMDDGVTIDKSSIAVKIKDQAVDSKYYTVEETPTCEGKCDFHVTMDLIELFNAGIISREEIKNAESIIITYSATVNKDIKPGNYKNTAWVDFTGSKDPSVPDDPDVDVYGIYLKKVDQYDDSKVLAGAEFTLYAADKTTELATAESDENGIAKFDVSLKAGTYYVKEIEAPTGYVASSDLIEVVIEENDTTVNTGDKDAFDYYYKGTKVPNVSVPETGGMGTDSLYMTGVGIVAAAGLIYFITRRKRTA